MFALNPISGFPRVFSTRLTACTSLFSFRIVPRFSIFATLWEMYDVCEPVSIITRILRFGETHASQCWCAWQNCLGLPLEPHWLGVRYPCHTQLSNDRPCIPDTALLRYSFGRCGRRGFGSVQIGGPISATGRLVSGCPHCQISQAREGYLMLVGLDWRLPEVDRVVGRPFVEWYRFLAAATM